jgi:hypothetical protein
MPEWDDAHYLTKGIDLTPIFGSYASAIEQAIEQAQPASTWYGGVLHSVDTPPVTGAYIWHKRSLWINADETGIFWYKDSVGSWENLSTLLDTTPQPGSITLAMLADEADARQVLRRNSLDTAYQWVNPLSIFNAGEITLDKIVPAAGDGYFLLTGGGGVPAYTDFSTAISAEVATAIAATDLAFSKVRDTLSQGIAGQVASLVGTGDYLEFNYVEDLLRANTTPTSRLLLTGIGANKLVSTNGSANDLIGVDPSTITGSTKVATFRETQTAGTDGTAVTGVAGVASFTTIELNDDTGTDPDGIVVVAANKFVPIVGDYLINIVIPFWINNSGGTFPKLKFELYNVTTTTTVAYVSFLGADNTNTVVPITLTNRFTANGTDEYSLRVKFVAGNSDPMAATCGKAISDGVTEIYTQVSLTKIG